LIATKVLSGLTTVATMTNAAKYAPANSFATIIDRALVFADWLCIGTIMFSGLSWMLGNKTKALEHLISACTGYIVIRHAKDIQVFLSTI
jgi:hypothetical protein